MRIFGSTKSKEKLVAVFNVGSSSIGGEIFLFQDSGIPKIVFSVREIIAPQEEINANNFLGLTLKVLDRVAKQVATSPFGAPTEVHCVLSSPWYVSQNRIIKLEKNTPFIFNAKLADSLIQKEIKLFEEEHVAKYKSTSGGVRIIEFKNIKTLLNNYEILNPFEKTAKSIEMMVFISMSGEDTLASMESVLFKHFHQREVKFASFLLASFSVIQSMYINQDNFLIIDIGGEVTDISMAKKNILRESVSYPIGINFIVRNIASSMRCSLDEAKSMFFLYKDGHAEEKIKQKIDPIINIIKSEWLNRFQSSLSNLSNDISIPATLFVTIDREYAEFFAEIIKTEQFNQYTLTDSKFQIIFLTTETFHGVATFDNDTVRDTCLIIDALYINRFLK